MRMLLCSRGSAPFVKRFGRRDSRYVRLEIQQQSSGGAPLDIVAELEASWVTAQEAASVRGYVCLVSRIHAVDLHDLPATAAVAFMRDAQLTSKVLSSITGAVKLNYEIHGNLLPHLHMHFFPRYRADQFEGQPINPKLSVQPVYGCGEFERIRRAFLVKLGELRC